MIYLSHRFSQIQLVNSLGLQNLIFATDALIITDKFWEKIRVNLCIRGGFF